MAEQTLFEQTESVKVEYREIPGFPGYRVGDDGSIWSCLRRDGRWKPRAISNVWSKMKPYAPRGRYPHVNFYIDGRVIGKSLHTLVLEAFVGPRPDGMEACHNNGDPSDNRAYNLRWDTHLNNQRDRICHGTVPRGKKSGHNILSEFDVLSIKRRLSAGDAKNRLAAEYGVSPSAISAIASGANWSWLKESA